MSKGERTLKKENDNGFQVSENITEFSKQSDLADFETGIGKKQLIAASNPEHIKAAKLTREKVTIHEMINFDRIHENPVKVSIVVPVCNVEQYLRECLDSCINQTLQDIEIICVNDGSSDGSLEILKEYAKSDNRVKVIDKDNAGYGHAMNIGMDMAQGEYIGIVESDDFVELDMYEELYETAEKNKADWVKGDFKRFIETENQRMFSYIKSAWDSFYGKILNPQDKFEVFKFNMQTWSGIYKKDFIVENNIRHNETPGASFQDNGFCYKTYCHAKRIYYLNKSFYCYRFDNPNSSIHNPGKTDAIITEFDLIKQYVDSRDISPEYQGLYYWKKFKSYLYTVERISYELKYDFFMRISKEFKELLDNSLLEEKYFGNNDWKTLLWITSDPEEYYNIRIKKQKISVIIPAFNVKDYVEECINSITSQTLQEIEIICIDDGSTDNTYQVIKKLAEADKRIQLYRQSNIGVGATRNKGIDMAHGQFVIFMDPDDYYPSDDVLETLYDNAVNNNVLISGGSFSDILNGKINTTFKGTLSDYIFETEGVYEYKDYQFDYGFHRFIYNTDMLRDNKIYFPNLKRFQDPPFFIVAMNKAERFYGTDKIVYRYRRKSTPMAWTEEKLMDALSGVVMDLKLSSQLGFTKLHSLSVQRLFITFKSPITELVNYENIQLLNIISEINSLIDENLIDTSIVEYYRKDFLWAIILRDMLSIRSRLSEEVLELKRKNTLEIRFTDKDVLQRQNEVLIKNEFEKLRRFIQEVEEYKTQLLLIRASFSYKVGLFITWLPRKIRGLFKRGRN